MFFILSYSYNALTLRTVVRNLNFRHDVSSRLDTFPIIHRHSLNTHPTANFIVLAFFRSGATVIVVRLPYFFCICVIAISIKSIGSFVRFKRSRPPTCGRECVYEGRAYNVGNDFESI